MLQKDTDLFLEEIESRLQTVSESRKPFTDFLEEKMDQFDYSNTSLARKVFHRAERKGEVVYVPVTRQTIGAWQKGSMPSSREIYITLGMAFHMNLEEINHILLETYMGYGLYCKNIEDALWIALINGLLSIDELEGAKEKVEEILENKEELGERSLNTMDLWVMLSEVRSMDQFYGLISLYRDEFREGTRKFGQCLEEVIEEEYGYYEKASWLLRDIGLLHCEAQFSKIKAGKAVVTREWLLRFCIALQPTLASIEKLLAKAQMEPLGVTPAEIILEMIAKYKSDSLANSQDIWMLLESVAEELQARGYEIDDALCRKYDSVYQLPASQKWWLCILTGRELLRRWSCRDYGYEKKGYCRYAKVDRILFEDMNRCKKNSVFKKEAALYMEEGLEDWNSLEKKDLVMLAVSKEEEPDVLELEKFEDYCYMRRPSRFSKDFLMNDIYFFSALIYSIWTGKCYRRDWDTHKAAEFKKELEKQGFEETSLGDMLGENLKEDAVYQESCDIGYMMDVLCRMSGKNIGKGKNK